MTTIVFQGRMINIGLDDAGQSYYYEYLNKNGQLQEFSGYSWCNNHQRMIEDYFGAEDHK